MIQWLLSLIFPKSELDNRPTICQSDNCIRCGKNETLLREAESNFKHLIAINDVPKKFQRIAIGFESGKSKDHLFYMNELTSLPVWGVDELPLYFLSILDENVSIICDELFQLSRSVNSWFQDPLNRHKCWKKFYIMNQGTLIDENVRKCPKTYQIVASLPKLMENCAFGYVFFSELEPNSSIEEHRGPTNLRLRCHLPLQVPEPEESTRCYLSVAGKTVEWTRGKCLVFDDSLKHSVIFETGAGKDACSRIVLIVDLWHPDLTQYEIGLICKLFPPK